MGRPKVELALSDEERSQLQSFARSRSLPAALSNRARIVLSSADGEPNNAIAERLKLTNATVGKWRARFIERRIPGLYDDVRPGKPHTIDDERVARLINTTLHTKPADGSTHWSVRTVAAETGISKSSVARYSRTRPFAGDHSPASSNSSNASTTSSPPTTPTANPSGGPPPRIRCSKSCIDFAHLSAGRDTRSRSAYFMRMRDSPPRTMAMVLLKVMSAKNDIWAQ
ncbi:hypothetical protein AVHM3334_14110 [Acidovorax sp. SUPP3334]|nr:hypothetical protein AVHM3334_14110 [Acidovorax sp. SUPP3334]